MAAGETTTWHSRAHLVPRHYDAEPQVYIHHSIQIDLMYDSIGSITWQPQVWTCARIIFPPNCSSEDQATLHRSITTQLDSLDISIKRRTRDHALISVSTVSHLIGQLAANLEALTDPSARPFETGSNLRALLDSAESLWSPNSPSCRFGNDDVVWQCHYQVAKGLMRAFSALTPANQANQATESSDNNEPRSTRDASDDLISDCAITATDLLHFLSAAQAVSSQPDIFLQQYIRPEVSPSFVQAVRDSGLGDPTSSEVLSISGIGNGDFKTLCGLWKDMTEDTATHGTPVLLTDMPKYSDMTQEGLKIIKDYFITEHLQELHSACLESLVFDIGWTTELAGTIQEFCRFSGWCEIMRVGNCLTQDDMSALAQGPDNIMNAVYTREMRGRP